ncbi:hypothetical protein ABZZ36_03940 [Actinacidiphila glaucinigra]|uniref:hypothetical protein n=1 Tax=Actinacidiphila glaucinigra TaxID=235986 RepID=UPI0033B6312D
MTEGDAAVWDFTRGDGFRKPTRTPPAISFGRPACGVREFLDEVERVVAGDSPGPSVNTTTARSSPATRTASS